MTKAKELEFEMGIIHGANTFITDIYGRPLYGDPNNRAWQQHLYLQCKAREAHEARVKQVEDAERWVREMREQNGVEKIIRSK